MTRTGFTAELGYDIYVDVPVAGEMFSRLWDEMRKNGVKLCGSRALNLRRVEAGIINFGQDFDWQHTPFQVGLGWMVNDRKGLFHGREALQPDSVRHPPTRLAGLRLEGSEVAAGGDSVLADNTEVGLITSAVLSPSLNRKHRIGDAQDRGHKAGTVPQRDVR